MPYFVIGQDKVNKVKRFEKNKLNPNNQLLWKKHKTLHKVPRCKPESKTDRS